MESISMEQTGHNPVTDRTGRDPLDCLLSPRSIAIIGVSSDFNKLNGRVMKFLLEKGYTGRIFPVNPKYEEVGGHPCFAAIGEIGEVPDLAVISVPAKAVPGQIEAAGQAGVRAAIVFSSGFGEMGEEGRRAEQQVVEIARRHGMRLCGPNTLGVINAFDGAFATFTQYGMGPTQAGPVGFVTQSGAFGTAIAALARKRGLGLGYFANTGNETDVTFADCLGRIAEDSRITTLAGYIEGITDGPGFVTAARRAMELGKPLVVTKVGRTDAGARAASSHTGALAGEDAVFDGIARQYGVIRARNEEHMLDIVDMSTTPPCPEGRGVGIVTQSGGAGVLMSDRAEEVGLEVPRLSEETMARLKGILPDFGAAGNPVDVTAQFIADPSMLKESVKAVLDDPNVHVAAVWLQLMDGFVDTLTETFRELKAETEKPFVVAWVAAPEEGLRALRELGICALRGAEPTIDAIAALVDWNEARKAWLADQGDAACAPLPAPGAGFVPTEKTASMLAEAGVPVARVGLAGSADEAVEIAEGIGWPVAVKIESADILHKTEIGGVEIGIDGPEELRAAYERIVGRAKASAPEARIDGVIVQEMGQGNAELVIGLRRDPGFGPVVMVGMGGILIEVQKDVVFHRAPVSESEAARMLDRLKSKQILNGVRGAPPVDRAALCRMIAAVSRFGASAGDWLQELDLNPVLAGPEGAIAVDCLLISDR
ncbi:acetate--CoA ligase family protein [Roseovarius sp.]|uniref:acetate--CoA ligase family protein n=1 Tax=Roseovarius sp. TaxID=1486281 RepID=UPI0026138685|nr:acetate--CoA ligase family protein [Roseovarius sp.]MDM8165779.1 acetate--CoA ligase family protein [Roseovarius sp.]